MPRTLANELLVPLLLAALPLLSITLTGNFTSKGKKHAENLTPVDRAHEHQFLTAVDHFLNTVRNHAAHPPLKETSKEM